MRIITMYIENSDQMYGGAYRRYMELINAFLKNGWYVDHLSPIGFSNIKHNNFKHHGIKKLHIYPAYLPFTIQVIYKALLLYRKNDFDLVFTFTIFDALIGIVLRIFHPKTRVIFCDRGDTVTGFLIDLKEEYNYKYLIAISSLLLRKFEGYVYKNVDKVIFNSNIRKNTMIERVGLNCNKISLIYNNANPSWVISKIEQARNLSNEIKNKWGQNIICFVGNLFIKGRDLDTLLKAFKIINYKIQDSVLLIVGDGPDKEKLGKMIDHLGLNQEHISLEGWQDNPYAYMLASNINLVTAMHEGCSNTILEAIYCENVIMGTKIGGIPELLKYDELMFDPKNEIELAEKIIKILTNKEDYIAAKQLIKQRKKQFMFDWNEVMINSLKN